MSRIFTPTILLLGCGYSLTRLLRKLSPSKVIFTVSNNETLLTASNYVSRLYQGEVLELSDKSGLRDLMERYPSIDTVIDSVPPLSSAEHAADPLVGVKNVCEVLSKHPIKRFIYLSTTGVFGVDDGSTVDEQTPCNPKNTRGKNRLEAEKLYNQLTTNSSALRIAAIYGPQRGIGTALKKGNFKLIKDQDRWSNRIHVEDLVTTLELALDFRGILPRVLCVADDKPARISEIVDYYCDTFKINKPGEITADQITDSESSMYTSNQQVSNALLKKELGLTLSYPSYLQGAGTEF